MSQLSTSYHLIFTPILTVEGQLQAFDVYLATSDSEKQDAASKPPNSLLLKN